MPRKPRKEMIRVTRTINGELCGTEKEVEMPGSFQEFLDELGEDGCFRLMLNARIEEEKESLSSHLVEKVTGKSQKRRATAKMIEL